jgi:DNA polymerase-3 subunit beta
MHIDRDVFLGAIRAVGEVVESRVTIPILSNLLIEAAPGRWSVVGTDLDLQATMTFEGQGEGTFTVPADKLAAAVDSLRPGKVDLRIEAGRLTLLQGRARRTLPTLPIEDYPKLPADHLDVVFQIDAPVLRGLLEATYITMSSEEKTRVYLCGVYLHVHEGKLCAASTDGVRMVCAEAPLPQGADQLPGIILPKKLVLLLRRHLAKMQAGDRIDIRASDQKVLISFGTTVILAKLIDGNYPDYRRIIPIGNDRPLRVHSGELVRAIGAASALVEAAADGTGRSKGLAFRLTSTGCELRSSGGDANAVEPLEGEFTGDDFEIGLNALYAAPVAGIFGEAAELELLFADAKAPVLFRSPTVPSVLGIVMPMRI